VVYDLIIVGAGAAGLFAAANVPSDIKTLILEKTAKPGQKLLLTGSGQCNITNDEPIKNFLKRYGDNGKQLRNVLFKYSNIALKSFFEENGLPLQTRDDGKVFPKSKKSTDVVNLLVKLAKKQGVEFYLNCAVTNIEVLSAEPENNRVYKITTSTIKTELFAKNVLIATGGLSYPQTGSDGSVNDCIEQLGIKIIPQKPALTPVFVRDYPYKSLSGVTLDNCELKLNNKIITGSLLFTHKGFSGLAILECSRYATKGDSLIINYLPEYTEQTLRKTLIQKSTGEIKQIITVLGAETLLPKSFLEIICENCKIDAKEKASRLSGAQIGILAQKLTAEKYEISGTGDFDTAMVTVGGVCLDEIDLKTMQAVNHPGLYFAGEVLDVDGDTGGYNLQFAFSSAMLGIKSICC